MNKHVAGIQTVLVTGAAGFLGKHLINVLLKKQAYNVFAFDLSKKQLKLALPDNTAIKFFDFSDLEQGKIPFKKVDIVVHCAFTRSNTGHDLAASLIFAQQIFSLSAKNNCKVINISSRSVYGQNPNTPWNEMTSVEPDSLYALAKFNSELLLKATVKLKTVALNTNIRLAGLVGPEMDARIVNKFIQQALKGEPITITGGKQQFAYLDVRDAADGIIALLQASKGWKPVYNLGYLRSYTITEIAETVSKVARKSNCPKVKINIERTDEALYAEIDSTLFYTDTTWQPKYDMEAMVQSVFDSSVSQSC